MKKFLYIAFALSTLTFSTLTYGGWYNPQAEMILAGPATWCSVDGDATGGSPDFGGYTYDSSVVGWGPAGFMICQYWDSYTPTSSVSFAQDNSAKSWWSNNVNQVVNISLSDLGGSRLAGFRVEYTYATNSPTFSNWSGWSTYPGMTGNVGGVSGPNSYSNSYAFTAANGTAYKFRVYQCDNAGNCDYSPETPALKVDTIAPSFADISTIPAEDTNLLATTSQSISISSTNHNGAPIDKFEAYFEDFNTADSLTIFRQSTNGTLATTENIKDVDKQRDTNGSRKYTYKVTKVCDLAGNCGSNPRTFNYFSYANTTNPGTVRSVSSDLEAPNNIADGTVRYSKITLKDIYGNQIVPASGIGRTIDINFTYDNKLYINQFNRSGGSSVFATTPNDAGTYDNTRFPIESNSAVFNSLDSSDGTYNFNFKAYTPTKNQDYGPASDNEAVFDISNITYDVNNGIGAASAIAINLGLPITSKFSPLYYTTISGDITEGITEGMVQESNILITKKGTSSPTNANLNLTFLGTDSSKFKFRTSTAGIPGTLIGIVPTIHSAFSSAGNIVMNSKNLQNPGTVLAASSTYLASHLSYSLDGLSIIYNSDLVGKSTFFDATVTSSTLQKGIKTSGIVGLNSNNNIELTTGQAGTDYNSVGNNQGSAGILQMNQKAMNKTVFKMSAYAFMKNNNHKCTDIVIDDLDGGFDNELSAGTNSSIIYYDRTSFPLAASKIISLGDGINNEGISGKRTILIYGGNLYIKSNLFYANNSSILGIMVLQDENGNGGNIYIDPSVTNIVGTLFADKSVFSYSTADGEISGDLSVSKLKNQLHIYGSIISENTLGGSRLATPKCPSYVTGTCDLVTAQKYDLNFLRRYFLTVKHIPFGNGKVSGGGTCPIAPVAPATSASCSGHDSNLSKNRVFYNTADQYAAYPIIVEYNSYVQTNTPPLFDIK